MNPLDFLPKMLTGEELRRALAVVPEMPELTGAATADRLMALSTLNDFYYPMRMTEEIYTKLYLALARSLQKKFTPDSIKQGYENHNRILGGTGHGVIGGSDSFTIIGPSGIGKSAAIQRSIEVITAGRVIESLAPYSKVIPVLSVQCPFDCSPKSLLIDIAKKIDTILGTDYSFVFNTRRTTTDILISSISQVLLNHVGLLIIDEIQNVVANKHGIGMMAMVTQLINNSGISICMVGTPDCKSFFGQEYHLARRSIGLDYSPMTFDDSFFNFCNTLLDYQFTIKRLSNDEKEAIINWLFTHSNGNISVVVALMSEAQELALLEGREKISIPLLNTVFETRLQRLHTLISTVSPLSAKRTPVTSSPVPTELTNTQNNIDIKSVLLSKKSVNEILPALRELINVEEIAV